MKRVYVEIKRVKAGYGKWCYKYLMKPPMIRKSKFKPPIWTTVRKGAWEFANETQAGDVLGQLRIKKTVLKEVMPYSGRMYANDVLKELLETPQILDYLETEHPKTLQRVKAVLVSCDITELLTAEEKAIHGTKEGKKF